MSGGSYDYAFHKVDDMADRLGHSADPLRVAFSNHLRLVARAMHDIERVDSADMSLGRDAEAIRAILGANSRQLELGVMLAKAEEVRTQLEAAIAAAKGVA